MIPSINDDTYSILLWEECPFCVRPYSNHVCPNDQCFCRACAREMEGIIVGEYVCVWTLLGRDYSMMYYSIPLMVNMIMSIYSGVCRCVCSMENICLHFYFDNSTCHSIIFRQYVWTHALHAPALSSCRSDSLWLVRTRKSLIVWCLKYYAMSSDDNESVNVVRASNLFIDIYGMYVW